MIQLDYRDSRPIYEQVKDGMRKLMVSGVLAPGDKLPSVRQLATELAINPNTIQRAYNELEAEGFIVSVGGKGNFVAEESNQTAERKKEVASKLQPIFEELKALGMDEQELLTLWRGGKNND